MTIGRKIVALGQVARVQSGHAFKSSQWVKSGIPVVKIANVKSGRIDLTASQAFVTAKDADEAVRFRLKQGDIVIGMTGYVGEVAQVRSGEHLLLNQRVGRVNIDERAVDRQYLFHLMCGKGFRSAAMSLAYGSAQPNISPSLLHSIPIPLPPIPEQRAIAATLGALDDKIESNRRTVETLEELGAAILEAELSLDVYGFPEYRSDLRMGDMVSLLETGSRPKGGVTTEGQGVVSLGAESIQSAGFTNTTSFKKVSREFVEGMRRGRLTDGDILIYKDGGSPGNFVPHVSAFGYGFPVKEATINEHVYRARGSDDVSQGLLYWLLRSPWMDGEMRKRGTGVAIPGLNSTNFRDLPWPVITPQTQRGLNDILHPMLVHMLRLGAENRQIALLRDALLPELLSGRIHPAVASENE